MFKEKNMLGLKGSKLAKWKVGLFQFLLLLLLSFIFIIPVTASPGWWNSSWDYRKPINLSNTGGDLTDYQVKVELTILNIQSYPTLGGNWTVRFNTTGRANLTISAVNGTTWSLDGKKTDLQFLEIKCGNQTLNYTWINNSVFISDYSCNSISYETSKVLTTGKHTLQFTFGNLTKYAYNTVTSITLNSPANQTATNDNTPDFNFTPISDINTTFSCELFIDDTGYGANDSVQNDTATIITANSSLSDSEYNWYINCTDVNGTSKSETREITIDTTNPTTNATAVNEDGSDYTFDTWTNSNYVNVTLNCSDSGSGCNITQYCSDTTNNCTPTWWNLSWDYRKQINITGYNWTTTGTNSTLLEVDSNSLAHFIQIHDLNNQSSEYTNLTVEYENDTATEDATVYVNTYKLGTVPLSQDTYTFTNVSQSWLTEANPVNITYSSTGLINITESSLLYFVNLSDYQVNISVVYDSDMQVDFDDIRFTYLNDTTEQEIPYWIGKNTEIVENSTQLDTTSSASHFVSVTDWIPSGNATLTSTYLNDSMSGTTTVYVEGNSLGTLPLTTDSYTFTNVSQSWLDSSTNITYSTNGTANITESSLEYYLNKSKTWVKVPFIEANSQETLYMYYGNPSAPSASNGDDTFEFFDDFLSDTTGDYTWHTTDTNAPTNSHNWNSAEHWVEIKTGDNDWESPEKAVDLPTSGYAKIIFIKRKDYPTDNTQYLNIKQDGDNYYRFEWEGSGYSGQGVYKIVGGSTVDSSTETGTVDTNGQEFTVEMWWTSSSLRLDIDGTTRKDITTTDTTEITPSSFYFYNTQIDDDWESISIRKYATPEPTSTIGSEQSQQKAKITTEGTSYIRFRSNDTVGNLETTKNETIKLDTTPPTTTPSAVKEDGTDYTFDTWTSSTYVNVSLSCEDLEVGCDIIQYCTDTDNTCNPNQTYSTPVQISTEGTSYIRFRSNDTLGNLEATKSETIEIDTTEPNMSWEYPIPDNNSYKTENYIEINLTVDELHLDSFKFNWHNGTNWTNSSFYDSNLVLGMNLNNNSAIGENSTKAVDISKYGNDGTIAKPGDWWNESFKYRKKLTITNNNATNLTIGEPINFTLDTASLVSEGKLLANGDDLRIVCGGGEVNRTNTSSFNSTTEIWFKSCVQINAGKNSGNNFYIYYGNSEAGIPGTGGITTEQNFNLSQSLGSENLIRAQWATGKFGNGLEFDGVDDYVDLGDPSSCKGMIDLTVVFYLKARDLTSNAGLMDFIDSNAEKNTWAFRRYEKDLRWFIGGTSDGYINDVFNGENEWRHYGIVFTDSSDKLEFFRNGELVGSDTGATGNIGTDASVLRIATDIPGSMLENGSIDEVRIYNRALSADEIKMHYQSEFSKYNSTQYRFYDNLSVENQTHKFNVWANDTVGWSSENEIIVHTNTISISNLSFEDSETKHEFNISTNATHTGGVDKFTGCHIYCSNCSWGSETGNLNKTESPARCNLLINGSDMGLRDTANFNISFRDSYEKERFSNTEEHSLPNVAPEISSLSITDCSEGHCFNVFANATDLNGAMDISSCTIHYYNPTGPGVEWNFFPGTLSCGSNSCNCTEQISNSTTNLGNDIENEIEVYVEFEDSSGATDTSAHYNNSIINHEPTAQLPSTTVYQNEHAFNVSAGIGDADSDSLTCTIYLTDGSCTCEEGGTVSGDNCKYSKVSNGTCGDCNFNVKDWIDIIVEVADSWDKTNSSSVSQQIPNRVPGVPQSLELLINDSFNNSTHVVTNHPLINWTNPADDENDTIEIKAWAKEVSGTYNFDNNISVNSGNFGSEGQMTLGYGVQLEDGKNYTFELKACDNWDCSKFNESGKYFRLNTKPIINWVKTEPVNLTDVSNINLTANVTDNENDLIEWTNFTVYYNNYSTAVNTTELSLNDSADYHILDLWNISSSGDANLSVYYNYLKETRKNSTNLTINNTIETHKIETRPDVS